MEVPPNQSPVVRCQGTTISCYFAMEDFLSCFLFFFPELKGSGLPYWTSLETSADSFQISKAVGCYFCSIITTVKMEFELFHNRYFTSVSAKLKNNSICT